MRNLNYSLSLACNRCDVNVLSSGSSVERVSFILFLFLYLQLAVNLFRCQAKLHVQLDVMTALSSEWKNAL